MLFLASFDVMTKPQNRHVLEPDCNDSKGNATSNLSANLSSFITKCSQHLKNYQNITARSIWRVMFTIARSPISHNHKHFYPVVFYNLLLKIANLQPTLKVLNKWPDIVSILFKAKMISNRAMHWRRRFFVLKECLYTYIPIRGGIFRSYWIKGDPEKVEN